MSDELELAAHPRAVERPSKRLPLSPAERQARRRNRRWLLIVFWASVALLIGALFASGVAQSNEPSGPSISVPAGYKAVKDGYFTYAVPSTWSTNQAYTDEAGDVEVSGTTGWAAEHIAYRVKAPTTREIPPAALEAFGMPRPEPYTLGTGRAVRVTGTDVAYSYPMTRPGGFRATAVDTWNAKRGVELWLLVHAPPSITAKILGTLQA